MTDAIRLLGAVLAGGEGRRFGAPKADVKVGGVSMVRRAVEALRPSMAEVIVVSSRPVADAPVEVVPDTVAGSGPLGGLSAALARAAERGLDGVFLLACDLPLVDEHLVRRIVAAVGDAPAVAPARRGGREGGVETTCAIYRVGVLAAVDARLTSEDRSLRALFRDVDGSALPDIDIDTDPHAPAFLNVNTPDDRVRAERALTARAGRAE